MSLGYFEEIHLGLEQIVQVGKLPCTLKILGLIPAFYMVP